MQASIHIYKADDVIKVVLLFVETTCLQEFVALGRPPLSPMTSRRPWWWRRRAFVLDRSCVHVAAVLETVGRNVVVLVPLHYISTPLGNPPVARPRFYPVYHTKSP